MLGESIVDIDRHRHESPRRKATGPVRHRSGAQSGPFGEFLRAAEVRKYTDELKAHAVRSFRDADPQPSIRQHARDIGVNHEALRSWIRQADTDPGDREGKASGDLIAKNRELRKRIADLEKTNSLLRSASAYFASEIHHAQR
ncbi:transposase [Nocardia sp. X0981]